MKRKYILEGLGVLLVIAVMLFALVYHTMPLNSKVDLGGGDEISVVYTQLDVTAELVGSTVPDHITRSLTFHKGSEQYDRLVALTERYSCHKTLATLMQPDVMVKSGDTTILLVAGTQKLTVTNADGINILAGNERMRIGWFGTDKIGELCGEILSVCG